MSAIWPFSGRIVSRVLFQTPSRRRLVAVTPDCPQCLMTTLKIAMVISFPDTNALLSTSGFHMPKAALQELVPQTSRPSAMLHGE